MDFRDLYKENPLVRGLIETRKKSAFDCRRSKRLEIFNKNRINIDAITQEISEQERTKEKEINDRRALLLQWKEKKNKMRTVEKKKKPFVVGVIHHSAASPVFRDVSNVNKKKLLIKQFPFTSPTSTKKLFKFAVKPSVKKLTIPQSPNFMSAKKKKLNEKMNNGLKLASEKKTGDCKENIKRNLRPMRCRARLIKDNEQNTGTEISKNNEIGVINSSTSKIKQSDQTKLKKVNQSETNFLSSVTYGFHTEQSTLVEEKKIIISSPTSDNKDVTFNNIVANISPVLPASAEIKVLNTPESDEVENFVISPFVTKGRGKQKRCSVTRPIDSAKKQNRSNYSYEERESTIDPEVEGEAAPYYARLDKETKNLIEQCEMWSKISLSRVLPKEIEDEVDSAVGQTRLLVQDKFQQFRSLIQRFEFKVEPPVTINDLDGFWDVIYIQVEKLHSQFSKLQMLKENNWISAPTEPKINKQAKKIIRQRKSRKVQGNFREFLKGLKRCNELDKSTRTEDNSVVNIHHNAPEETENLEPSGTPTRKSPVNKPESLLKKVFRRNSQAKNKDERRRSSTAGAFCALNTSIIGKELGTSPVTIVERSFNIETVNKSILKKQSPDNREKIKKKVLFKHSIEISSNNEDDLNTTFSVEDDKQCYELVLSDSPVKTAAVAFGDEITQAVDQCGSPSKDTVSGNGLVTPKHSRRRTPEPGFTPRRSLRILAKAELNLSLLSGGDESSSFKKKVFGTPHPKRIVRK
ncbi:uncharacterized protein LOC142324280 isoform X2 [Lycorma delicatula]|uniref:uncharacterized protein LOC142324280 isoform X2 n=1 Tax=Lycorma delicatula TaxID=130591 RepID=UPI003F518262